MRKIIITTTKIVHVQVMPDIPEGLMQAMEKRKAEIDKLMAKRKRMMARWEKKRKKEELEGVKTNEQQ
jgi:hypothetical protein